MFALNEKVVYPGYGVAIISCVVDKVVGGSVTKFFELKFHSKDMTILVPMENSRAAGLRRISSSEKVQEVLHVLSEPVGIDCEMLSVNWNKRNKEYHCKLRSGDLYEICKIYRDLKYISSKKELSFGEKNLLHKTEALLAEEISIVNHQGEEKTIEHLRARFS